MARTLFVTISILTFLATVLWGIYWSNAFWLLIVVLPFIALGCYDMLQRRHTILRIYPVIGHLRFFFESIRPEIQQYFVESNTDGQPISREFRDLVYQRAKGQLDTRPFGTVFDVYRDGFEWVNHSLAPRVAQEPSPRIQFGGPACLKPYQASPLNISAMSFGALSKNAIMALNKGAKIDSFAHNTGEGA